MVLNILLYTIVRMTLKKLKTEIILTNLPPNNVNNYLNYLKLIKMRKFIKEIITRGKYTHVYLLFPGLMSLFTKKRDSYQLTCRQAASFHEKYRLPVFNWKNRFTGFIPE